LRINTAADDAAGLAVSEKLRTAFRGLQQAQTNAQDGMSVLQTAEGGLQAVATQLQRIRELAVQSANDSLTNDDRQLIQAEVNQLVDEIDRSASSVQFNNRQLLKNNFGTMDASGNTTIGNGSLVFHVGANRDETLTISTNDLMTSHSGALGMRLDNNGDPFVEGAAVDYDADAGDAIQLTTRQLAESAIQVATVAINSISDARARIGAVQNRLEGTIDFLEIQQENTQAAESRIRDADLAEEAVNRTRASILIQAGTSMLAQTNQTPQLALQLLG
jgi:flagellin